MVAQNLRHEGRWSSGKQKKQKIATLTYSEGEVSLLGRGEHALWENVHRGCIFGKIQNL